LEFRLSELKIIGGVADKRRETYKRQCREMMYGDRRSWENREQIDVVVGGDDRVGLMAGARQRRVAAFLQVSARPARGDTSSPMRPFVCRQLRTKLRQ